MRRTLTKLARMLVAPLTIIGVLAVVIGLVLVGHIKALRLPGVPYFMKFQVPALSAEPVLSQAPTAPSSPQLPVQKTTQPDWQQDFSQLPNGVLNSAIWRFETGAGGWGNNEVQNYTNKSTNVRIEDGHLVIEAKREALGDAQYTSARLTTKGAFAMQYGHLSINDVTLPRGAGTWPALWLWPVGAKYSATDMPGVGDQGLINGEIDITEYVGASPNEINASAHAYANYPDHNERSGQTVIDDTKPHNFGFDWTPDSLTFSIDAKPYYIVHNPHTGPANWPYDQPYFLVINVAMGGDWGGMAKDTYPPYGINDSSAPWRLKIGSISYKPL
jgi:beta-glucanase (GH16 family)